ncbi:chemotaxis protein [Sulfuricurvum sp. RIFCSPLOWO2_12_FULL_43_24]|uniref:chemotaxis protein n=1 Tax=Sulfuricurvum sp. RIFCSPLOWO2_12_FULL_43_24 TaxID=1802247 RepID=UPI0008AA9941|nr:chemotaxis protein [Sulfuricurvum sp. RIFCSPLOWO2_12_FULL_43_24]OHD84605.1 MAG: fused signal transduction protein/response regulator [Sulfuricurvum sp. RIFCSPHIGHO2_02_FULL_43_9]OHD85149.1 MAG: fused signal transduction protein/response regulator [Sulfuricurvum sp. RIFCSPLOWO2_02_FULL_43_45]OHD85512.1 MAG: fused signal transduction protein/response regulator [Sulfuricurvum sp. RIFCSPLOWO2_02_43_6]OHD89034.1 MAG: fused signal transduction protein/response regulator [Sulfuricurvum sp. RIFCSPHI
MKGQGDILKVGTNEMELVDFRIFKREGDEIYEGIYGVNVSKVREIIRFPKLTELPGTPPFIEGIFDLRGVVIPVVNLATWMGVEAPEEMAHESRVIITEFNNILIGFVVHEAKRIRRINWKDIEPASFISSSGGLDGSKITGVTRIEDDGVLLILDLEGVVQELGLYQPSRGKLEEGKDRFSGHVLLLDDSATARRIIKEALEQMGFDVIEATDGQQGLKILEDLYHAYGDNISSKLRLIASDIEMPLMDGFHFAANVKSDERFKMIPIVFNSSISDHFSEMRGREAGGEAYLVKFDSNLFYDEVARVVRAHIQ